MNQFGKTTTMMPTPLISTLLAATLLPLSSFAADVKIVPELGFSYRNYEYKINGDRYFKEIFPAIRYGLNIRSGRFFGNVYGESSIDSNQQTSVNSLFSSGTGAEVSRDDYVLTGGYLFNKSFAAFGGYKTGKTKVNYNINDSGVNDIKSSGFFAGVNYILPIGKAGAFSANIAYAVLDTDFTVATPTISQNLSPLGLNQLDLESDGSGFSLGLAWNSKISKNLQYSVGWDIQSYEYDDLTPTSTRVALAEKLELKERQDTFRVLLKYAF